MDLRLYIFLDIMLSRLTNVYLIKINIVSRILKMYSNSLRKVNISQNILFSPGYPSGKDYKDFNERGEAFNFYAQNYINEYK